jgi:hypothetical protein
MGSMMAPAHPPRAIFFCADQPRSGHGPQHRQDREYATIVIRGHGQVELDEDGSHMCLDGFL